jgi:hypothetical protein
MRTDVVIRVQHKGRGEPIMDRAEPEAESHRCFSCRWFVADLDNSRRRCTNQSSPRRGVSAGDGCEFWLRWR